MFKITENLATHGLGETTYPLAKDKLRTGQILEGTDFMILDCRDMRDEYNPPEVYEKKLWEAADIIETHGKVVIYCGAGQSRSPAIALGVLTGYYRMNFYDAHNMIRETVPIVQIEPSHITALKKMFDVGLP
jgi:protein-tyrosine phosphatase